MEAHLMPDGFLEDRPTKFFYTLLVAAFGLLLITEIFYIASFIPQIYLAGPVQDAWGLLPYLENNIDHNWLGLDLWTPQNSHRLVLLKLQFLTDYRFFHGSNYFLTATILGCVILQVLACLAIFCKRRKVSGVLVGLSASSILLSPSLMWTVLHNFNLHMLDSAAFAFFACLAYSKGLFEKSTTWLISGLCLAVLCNLSAFSLLAIWPAFFVLLLFNRAPSTYWFVTVLAFFLAFLAYMWWLPMGATPDQNFSLLSQISRQSLGLLTLSWLPGFAAYLLAFLSFDPASGYVHQLFALASLCWLLVAFRSMGRESWPQQAALAMMMYGLLFALMVAVGRGYLGDLAKGVRFQPIVLVYWAGCFISVLSMLATKKNSRIFLVVCLAGFCYLSWSVFGVASNLNKQLTEDYIRFSKSQMAYVSDNLEENAVYENMVKEWRKISYQGIVEGSRFLKTRGMGVFAQPIGRFALKHPVLGSERPPLCLRARWRETVRSDDPLIRNVFIDADDSDETGEISHILFYQDKKLNGIAVARPQPSLEKKRKPQWLGVARYPLSGRDNVFLAFHSGENICRVEIQP